VTVPETALHLRTAYSQFRDRFEVVGIADLDHDDLTEVFRGLYELCIQNPLTLIHDLLFIDVTVVILASLPPVKGQVMKAAKLIVESGSSGTKHILKFARVANVTKVIFTGSFSNVLHPDDSWNPIVVTEDGKWQND
jgi:nucleoside-diphosphate-sugar epimerase